MERTLSPPSEVTFFRIHVTVTVTVTITIHRCRTLAASFGAGAVVV